MQTFQDAIRGIFNLPASTELDISFEARVPGSGTFRVWKFCHGSSTHEIAMLWADQASLAASGETGLDEMACSVRRKTSEQLVLVLPCCSWGLTFPDTLSSEPMCHWSGLLQVPAVKISLPTSLSSVTIRLFDSYFFQARTAGAFVSALTSYFPAPCEASMALFDLWQLKSLMAPLTSIVPQPRPHILRQATASGSPA